MPGEVRPYLVPTAGVVVWGPWLLRDGTGWVPLPDALDGWDPGTDLWIGRTVKINGAQFESQTNLPITAVGLAVSWTSSTTGMTEAAPLQRFKPDAEVVCEALLAGERISGVVNIRSTIALVESPKRPSPGLASIPGSILSEHQQKVTLENVSRMFPVHELDFANTRLPPTASWHLETTTDLTSMFFDSFRVLINSRDTELAAAVARGAKDRRQQALLDELQAGVAAQLLELGLLLRSELAERDSWPHESVGDVLGRVVEASMLDVSAPPGAHELADFRTLLAGSVRKAGTGRMFA